MNDGKEGRGRGEKLGLKMQPSPITNDASSTGAGRRLSDNN